MIKISHLSVGILAVALAALLMARAGLPLAPSTELVSLAYLGLLNLQSAAQIDTPRRTPRLVAASALLLLVTALQALTGFFAMLPSELMSLFSLPIATCVILLQLWRRSETRAGMPPTRRTSKVARKPQGTERQTGTVKWFNTSKGFGFICADAGHDVFVHFRAIRGQGHRFLKEGQRVEFSLQTRERGLQADDVVALA